MCVCVRYCVGVHSPDSTEREGENKIHLCVCACISVWVSTRLTGGAVEEEVTYRLD